MLKKCIFVFLFCAIALIQTCEALARYDKTTVVLKSQNNGMFSVFFDVLALLNRYEEGFFPSIEVNFGTTGLYYDPSVGLNWWEYYFEPICLGGRLIRYKEMLGNNRWVDPYQIELSDSVKINQLIQRYIKVKPHISAKVDEFVREHFEGYTIIGVHYRGTDKVSEAPRLGYRVILEKILLEMEKSPNNNYKIFVASDEQPFIDYLNGIFHGRICFLEDGIRSKNGKPIHTLERNDAYKKGEDALIDCLLLSKTDLLIRTSSNLSKCSEFFNPSLRVIELSKRF